MDTDQLSSRLAGHLSELEDEPTRPLDKTLFEDYTAVLRQNGTRAQPDRVARLAKVVTVLQTDPTPAIHLLVELLSSYSFREIQEHFSALLNFTGGLALDASPFHHLTLTILDKATATNDLRDHDNRQGIFAALVQLWLCTSSMSIATEAENVICGLIENEQDTDRSWRSTILAPEVVEMLAATSYKSDSDVLPINQRQRTLAQARLLSLLPRLAGLDWQTAACDRSTALRTSLLEYAAMSLVDTKNDVLMHRCLIEYYTEMLQITDLDGSTGSSASLDFLSTQGIHERMLSLYLTSNPTTTSAVVDPFDQQFLYGPAASYLAAYARRYARHYTCSPTNQQTRAHLCSTLAISKTAWAHSVPPVHDLHVLASVPKCTILPVGLASGQTSQVTSLSHEQTPITLLPTNPTTPEVLLALSKLFSAPHDETVLFPRESPLNNQIDLRAREEAKAAGQLRRIYESKNPGMRKDLDVLVTTEALPELMGAARVLRDVLGP